jgi:hypothetical protein
MSDQTNLRGGVDSPRGGRFDHGDRANIPPESANPDRLLSPATDNGSIPNLKFLLRHRPQPSAE